MQFSEKLFMVLAMNAEHKRLPYHTFDIPVLELRRGYYSAVYFWREKRILENEGIDRRALMQIFNKIDAATVCGIDESLAVLKAATGHWKDYTKAYQLFDRYIELKKQSRQLRVQEHLDQFKNIHDQTLEIQHSLSKLWVDTHDALNICALKDGQSSDPHDALMTIEGKAADFAHLESIYLGILARSTRVATNTKRVVDAAGGKPVLFFADRFDRWSNQVSDGYAALKAGAFGVASNAMGEWWGVSGFGTLPHALIALYKGDTAKATLAFANHFPNENVISLVDFNNDCVATSLDVARSFKNENKKLWGVRLDTSAGMVDEALKTENNASELTGVCIPLVEKVRTALDNEGFNDVKIVVSGGFTAEKILNFEKESVPVDAYGVGSSLLRGEYDHTADIVQVEGKPMAKVGRSYRPSKLLKPFSWSEIYE